LCQIRERFSSGTTTPAAVAAQEVEWTDSYMHGHCECCDEPARVIHTTDPEAVDIYDDVGSEWWCKRCYLAHKEKRKQSEG
jgi:hypothetical protein